MSPGRTVIPAGILVVVALTTVGALCTSVFETARRARDSTSTARSRAWFVALLLGGWLAFTAWLASTGALQVFDARPSRLAMLPVAAIIASLLLARQVRVRALLRGVPREFPVLLQTMRVGVEVVLYLLFVDGLVPSRMTFERGNLDILVGLSAPIVGFAIRRQSAPHWLVVGWNLLGIGLLANIVQTVVRSLPGPLQSITDGVVPVVITTAPFVWIPAFFVPVALLGHVLSLWQWTTKSRHASVAFPPTDPKGFRP